MSIVEWYTIGICILAIVTTSYYVFEGRNHPNTIDIGAVLSFLILAFMGPALLIAIALLYLNDKSPIVARFLDLELFTLER
jgi:hypothetical protein